MKVVVLQSSSWGASVWISLILALTAITAVCLNFKQLGQSRSDNAKNRKLTVAAINREGRLSIYADSLAALRAAHLDLKLGVDGIRVTERATGGIAANGQPEVMPQVSLPAPNEDWQYPERKAVIEEFRSLKHKARLDLQGKDETGMAILEWLSKFDETGSALSAAILALRERSVTNQMTMETVSTESQLIKDEFTEKLNGLENDIVSIRSMMKEELAIE